MNKSIGRYRPVQCPFCNTTIQKKGLKTHIEAIHKGIRYNCDQCDYKATQPGGLKRHKLLHDVHSFEFGCDICDYQGKTQEYLNKHMKVKHGARKFGCMLCTFKSWKKEALEAHSECAHADIQVRCHQCDYETSSPKDLAMHRTLHHDVTLE